LGVIVGGFVWDWYIFEDFGGGSVLVWGFGEGLVIKVWVFARKSPVSMLGR
jgi:hypothetical protein